MMVPSRYLNQLQPVCHCIWTPTSFVLQMVYDVSFRSTSNLEESSGEMLKEAEKALSLDASSSMDGLDIADMDSEL